MLRALSKSALTLTDQLQLIVNYLRAMEIRCVGCQVLQQTVSLTARPEDRLCAHALIPLMAGLDPRCPDYDGDGRTFDDFDVAG
jgi:hypothetical protein